MNGAKIDRSRLLLSKNFSRHAVALRKHFELRFAQPRHASLDRFVWDYWHVPNQYTLLRTPASAYFSAKQYQAVAKDLLVWGRKYLGCPSISPPWLSLYVEGCRQEFHADLPHGPWAFVLSLTKQKNFIGGETQILKPDVLSGRGSQKNIYNELEQLSLLVAPNFNQLLVFDPSLPHAVRPVQGVQDPLSGRLVLHGWFTWPQLSVSGGLTLRQLRKSVDTFAAVLVESLGDFSRALFLQLDIEASGRCRHAKLCWWRSQTKPLSLEQVAQVEALAKSFIFPKSKRPSKIDLPIYINFF